MQVGQNAAFIPDTIEQVVGATEQRVFIDELPL